MIFKLFICHSWNQKSVGILFFFLIFIYLWLHWVFVSVRGLSLVAASGGHSSSRCVGLSLSRPLLLWSAGSVIVAHGPSCSAACGILPDQGSNPCPLHWQADSQLLRHHGSPEFIFDRVSNTPIASSVLFGLMSIIRNVVTVCTSCTSTSWTVMQFFFKLGYF